MSTSRRKLSAASLASTMRHSSRRSIGNDASNITGAFAKSLGMTNNSENRSTFHSSGTMTLGHRKSAINMLRQGSTNSLTKSIKSLSQDSGDTGLGGSSRSTSSPSSASVNHASKSKSIQKPSDTTLLNVAEMILHGVADQEILDTWLRSIECEEFVKNFVDSGYDMPTLSRITPQDLTAIGVTEPNKRLKILAEIKKLNLQDGLPDFKPASLSHWLSLLRLDTHYYKALCCQQVDTIEKMSQMTWEDFEELGITKLGHQKRLLLAIDKLKQVDKKEAQSLAKTISEPIYDTNPSQILLLASAENHSMTGPILNKQSSTSEISSTGSGSMHSVYSAASTQFQQSNYAPLTNNNTTNNIIQDLSIQQHSQAHQSQQPTPQQQTESIYSQLPGAQIIYGQTKTQLQSHYQPIHQQQSSHQLMQNRQSLNQHNFASVLANLPKHQQQILQQSSIYATLSRQPGKPRQPPPVPIRTNSLKTNSLTDDTLSACSNGSFNKNSLATRSETSHQNFNSSQLTSQQAQTSNINSSTTTCGLYRSGTRVGSNRNQFNTHTMLTKNKSFSGNAHMEALRSRFLDRQNQQPQQSEQQSHFVGPQQVEQQPTMQQINMPMKSYQFTNGAQTSAMVQNNIYTKNNQMNSIPQNMNGYYHEFNSSLSQQIYHPVIGSRQLVIAQTQAQPNLVSSNGAAKSTNTSPTMSATHTNSQSILNNVANNELSSRQRYQSDDFDVQSDTNSTKSLMMHSSSSSTTVGGGNQLTHDDGSSQTLYNSASSGSTSNIFGGDSNVSHRPTLASQCQYEDKASIASDQHHNNVIYQHQQLNQLNGPVGLNLNSQCIDGPMAPRNNNVDDDDFPPPPSPLSLTDLEENDLVPPSSGNNLTNGPNAISTTSLGGPAVLNNNAGNGASIVAPGGPVESLSHRLMTFRIGM